MGKDKDEKTDAKDSPARLKLAVLLSGGGRTLENLARAIDDDGLLAKIVAVISSNPQAYGLTRAKQHKLPAQVVNRKDYASTREFSEPVWKHIRASGAEMVVLAGFLSLLTIPDDFVGRVINVHPALLPAFGGKGMHGHHVHEAVLAAGCKVSGCTVHFCDQSYDTGPIIVQRTCPVRENDTAETLAARVFEQECLAYPQAIALLAGGRVRIDGRRTIITPSGEPELIEEAKLLCQRLHAGQKRAGGRPYATHPFAVAALLREHGVSDPEVLAAAYLHDVVEDTDFSIFQLRQRFGDRVASLVHELTLDPEPDSFEEKHRMLAEHAKKMSPDAKLIKLADRAHNLSDITGKPPHKRKRYAHATQALLAALKPWPNEDLAKRVKLLAQPYLD